MIANQNTGREEIKHYKSIFAINKLVLILFSYNDAVDTLFPNGALHAVSRVK